MVGDSQIGDVQAASFEGLPHILIVDDDERIRLLVSRYLAKNGFLTAAAADAGEARALLNHFEFDAMVVDVMMPGETGLALTQSLRETSDIPVLLLTALGEAGDRIAGLEAGADDYLAKPFEPRELVLRLQAILRRRPKPALKNVAPVRIGRWMYNPETDELIDEEAGERQRLTSAEAALMRTLAAREGQAVSREELAEMTGMQAGERTVDVQVTRLRRKIEEDTRAPRFLLTIRGKGYMLRGGAA